MSGKDSSDKSSDESSGEPSDKSSDEPLGEPLNGDENDTSVETVILTAKDSPTVDLMHGVKLKPKLLYTDPSEYELVVETQKEFSYILRVTTPKAERKSDEKIKVKEEAQGGLPVDEEQNELVRITSRQSKGDGDKTFDFELKSDYPLQLRVYNVGYYTPDTKRSIVTQAGRLDGTSLVTPLSAWNNEFCHVLLIEFLENVGKRTETTKNPLNLPDGAKYWRWDFKSMEVDGATGKVRLADRRPFLDGSPVREKLNELQENNVLHKLELHVFTKFRPHNAKDTTDSYYITLRNGREKEANKYWIELVEVFGDMYYPLMPVFHFEQNKPGKPKYDKNYIVKDFDRATRDALLRMQKENQCDGYEQDNLDGSRNYTQFKLAFQTEE